MLTTFRSIISFINPYTPTQPLGGMLSGPRLPAMGQEGLYEFRIGKRWPKGIAKVRWESTLSLSECIMLEYLPQATGQAEAEELGGCRCGSWIKALGEGEKPVGSALSVYTCASLCTCFLFCSMVARDSRLTTAPRERLFQISIYHPSLNVPTTPAPLFYPSTYPQTIPIVTIYASMIEI